jgi:hypothetical protein
VAGEQLVEFRQLDSAQITIVDIHGLIRNLGFIVDPFTSATRRDHVPA